MASKGQLTGMDGVYLVAAELSRRGFIMSPTSRSAHGADLLITDLRARSTYAAEDKTNVRTFGFWLLGAKAKRMKSDTLIHALVNLKRMERSTSWFQVVSLHGMSNCHSRPGHARPLGTLFICPMSRSTEITGPCLSGAI